MTGVQLTGPAVLVPVDAGPALAAGLRLLRQEWRSEGLWTTELEEMRTVFERVAAVMAAAREVPQVPLGGSDEGSAPGEVVMLGTRAIADLAGVSDSYVRREIRGRRLAGEEGRAGWQVREAEVQRWLERRRKKGLPAA